MNKCVIFLYISISLTSCKNAFFYTDLYTRANRKSTFFQKTYESVNVLTIDEIRICHEFDWPGSRYRTPGKIFFQRDSLEEALKNAIGDYFYTVINLDSPKPFWDGNCDALTVKNYRKKETKFENQKYKGYSIIAALSIAPQTSKNIDADLWNIIDLGYP